MDSNTTPQAPTTSANRLTGLYRSLRSLTSQQVDSAVVLLSQVAVRLRLQRLTTCPRCKRDVTWSPQFRQFGLCPSCNYHFACPITKRIAALIDANSFSPFTRVRESVLAGTAKIENESVVLIAFDFRYHGGTMSVRAGKIIVDAFAHATDKQLPVIALIASGGVRVQEGLPALLQMASTTQAVLSFRHEHQPYIAVLTHPTTGGVYASFANLADVLFAEPGALIGFAGPRVAQTVTGKALPPESHRAEFAFQNGMIDAIIPRDNLRKTIARLLSRSAPATSLSLPGISAPESIRSANGRDAAIPRDSLALARHPDRPTARDYIPRLFTEFVELFGDRVEGDDPKIVGGVARFRGLRVVLIAQTRQRGTEFELGATAAGYRKAERLIKLSARLALPIVTLIDTPGADPGYESERHGIAGAIANTLAALLQTPVATVAVVIGEATSGGALALAAADRVLIQENATYVVISPEGGSAILFGNGSRAPDAANWTQMTVLDLHARGIVDRILPEPAGGAHLDVQAAAAVIGDALQETFDALLAQRDSDRLSARQVRYSK